MKHAAILFFALCATCPSLYALTDCDEKNVGSIIVTAVEIRAEQGGNLIFALYKSDENWLDLKEALVKKVVPVESDSVTVTFEEMPFDSAYAVQIIHDKNDNGKFDMRKFPFPKPKEGAGVSNNRLRWGPPEYEKAKFSLSSGSVSLHVKINY
jgi:uncharacterized protein (DUF2141 family)